MNIDSQKIVEALKQRNINSKQIEKLIEEAAERKMSLHDILAVRHILADEELGKLTAEITGFPYINLSNIEISGDILEIIPENIALKQGVITFQIDEKTGRIKLATVNPLDFEMIHDIEKKTGREVEVFYTTEQNIKNVIGKYHQELKHIFLKMLPESFRMEEVKQVESTKKKRKKTKAEEMEEEIPIVEIFEAIMLHAYRHHASDIHIEATKDNTVIRYRIDGVLHQVVAYPKIVHEPLITRCKIMAGLRIDETRAAQDGRIATKLDNDSVAFRVSILPTHFGEKVVMRLLVDIQESVNLIESGLSEEDYKKVIVNSSKPYGMMIVVGPTGSGKTTTLYNIIKLLNSEEINIATIEDPIEYGIEGINQVQVNHATNLTFANGLRSLLRQDPDNILVGEIRDEETAEIAIEASMTGHMVFTTLHANSAAVGVPRLVEMGIEPFLLTAAINCLIAQRLVRKLCKHCFSSQSFSRETLNLIFQEKNIPTIVQKIMEENLSKEEREVFGIGDEYIFYKANGCKSCGFTGYKGRIGIYEVMETNDPLKKAIIEGKSADAIEDIAVENGMSTMIENGIKKALAGITSLEEVIRVIKS
ncbi:type II/IV secretion system protein [Candidatus Peregrinibacteria bacterium]|nr:type II/IV secretion system protein [Candidatus Peregrinibacteria bacterium]